MAFCSSYDNIKKYNLQIISGPYSSDEECENEANIEYYYPIVNKNDKCKMLCNSGQIYDNDLFIKNGNYFKSIEDCNRFINLIGACYNADRSECTQTKKCTCEGMWIAEQTCPSQMEQNYYSVFDGGCHYCIEELEIKPIHSITNIYKSKSECISSIKDVSPNGACCINNNCYNITMCNCKKLGGVFYESNEELPCSSFNCSMDIGYACVLSGGDFCYDCIKVSNNMKEFDSLEECTNNCVNKCWIDECCNICPDSQPPPNTIIETKNKIDHIKINNMRIGDCKWLTHDILFKNQNIVEQAIIINKEEIGKTNLPIQSSSKTIYKNINIKNQKYILLEQLIYKDKILLFHYNHNVKEYQNLPEIDHIIIWFQDADRWTFTKIQI
jgi:hypothetical protein